MSLGFTQAYNFCHVVAYPVLNSGNHEEKHRKVQNAEHVRPVLEELPALLPCCGLGCLLSDEFEALERICTLVIAVTVYLEGYFLR